MANLKHRPARTAISVVGVALGVCLTVLTLGLVHGMIRARAVREANVGAEIIVREAGSGGLDTWASLRLPVQEASELRKIRGVKAAVPVGQYFIASTSGVGIRSIEGIPAEGYQTVSNIQIIDGRPLSGEGNEALIDVSFAASQKSKLNDSLELFGQPFRIVGIYAPESGPRIKIPLAAMQQYTGASNQCSAFLVKCEHSEEQQQVAQAIQQRFPDRRVILTRDLPAIYAQATPAINAFLDVVVGLEAVISVLVILLTMYTTIKERTREIGILKSLGASKRFIAGVIEKEAFLISLIGVIVGFIVSFIARAALQATMDLSVVVEVKWLLLAMVIGLASGLLGALYPALLAANQDPVKALSYE
ncbi:MAG: ABC transporter permease [Acidobacteria bacterium]|nr:ABC transporter permease [Acidobacteriota bacterium]